MARFLAEDPPEAASRDPARHSPAVSANRWRSLSYALAGCRYMLRYQKNTRIQLAATLIVLMLAHWLGLEPTGWALIIIVVGMVWLAEFINAAVEAVVNLHCSEYHPMAKVAKDVAAASVLLATVTSIVVGMIVLGPPLAQKLEHFAIVP